MSVEQLIKTDAETFSLLSKHYPKVTDDIALQALSIIISGQHLNKMPSVLQNGDVIKRDIANDFQSLYTKLYATIAEGPCKVVIEGYEIPVDKEVLAAFKAIVYLGFTYSEDRHISCLNISRGIFDALIHKAYEGKKMTLEDFLSHLKGYETALSSEIEKDLIKGMVECLS